MNIQQNVFLYTHGVYVTYRYLIECGIPESTVYNSVHKYHGSDIWNTVKHPYDSGKRLVAYSTIPDVLKVKYNLPDRSELQEICKKERDIQKEHNSNTRLKQIRPRFHIAHYDWRKYYSIYSNYFSDEKEIERHCKTHALIAASLQIHSEKYLIEDIFKVYSEYPDLVFMAGDPKSFANKLSKVRDADHIEDEILHGLRNKVGNATKLKEDVIRLIIRHYSNPKKYNGRRILDLVNDYLVKQNRRTISLSSVYCVIGSHVIQSQCMESRYGKKYANNHLFPHAYFTAPKKPGELWCIDGTRCQFIYKTAKKNHNFLYLFVLIDAMSRKVVGYSLDDSENFKMVLEAFEMACKNTKHLPKHIILDNSSAFNSSAFNTFRAKTKLWGVDWRNIYVGNSRDNGIVERFFGIFQENHCKKVDGYLGDGITSSNVNGKPSPEELKEHSKTEKIRTRDELKILISDLITEYNLSRRGKKPSPQQSYAQKKANYGVSLNKLKIVELFWELKEVTVVKSSIIFQVNHEQFIYTVYDSEFMKNYRNRQVKVRFNPKDPSEIYVFDKKDNYIIKVERFLPIPKVPEYRSEEDNMRLYAHKHKVQKLRQEIHKHHDELIEATDESLDNLPTEITEFSMVSKQEKEASETEYYESSVEVPSANMEIEEVEFDDEDIMDKLKNIYSKKGNLKIV